MKKRRFTPTPALAYERHLLIQNSLYLLLSRYAKEYVSLHAVLNRILLLFQQPVVLAVWDEEDKLRYHSLRDPELIQAVRRYLTGWRRRKRKPFDRLSLLGSGYYLSVHYVDLSGGIEKPRFRVMDWRDEDYRGLWRCLNNFKRGPYAQRVLIPTVKQTINDALHRAEYGKRLQNAVEQDSKKLKDIIDTLSEERIQPYIDELKESVFEPLFDDRFNSSPVIVRSFEHQVGPDGEELPAGKELPFPNIFLFLRTATRLRLGDRFPYTARLLLMQSQANKVAAHYDKIINQPSLCPHLKGKRCSISPELGLCWLHQKKTKLTKSLTQDRAAFVEFLQRPFSVKTRSFVDTVFASGVVDFADAPFTDGRERIEPNIEPLPPVEEDIVHQKLIHCLLHQIAPKGSSIEDFRAFVSPVMVGGAVWMTAATITQKTAIDECDNHRYDAWFHNYAFYFSILSRTIHRQVRTRAKEAYLDKVAETVCETALQYFGFHKTEGLYLDTKKFVEDVNERLYELSLIYPMDRVKLTHIPHGKEASDEIESIIEARWDELFPGTPNSDRMLVDIPSQVQAIPFLSTRVNYVITVCKNMQFGVLVNVPVIKAARVAKEIAGQVSTTRNEMLSRVPASPGD